MLSGRHLSCRALLDDLYQENLASLYNFLNLVAALQRNALTLDMFEVVTAHCFDGLAILALFRLLCFGFFGDQRFSIRDRNFVVIRMYLIERRNRAGYRRIRQMPPAKTALRGLLLRDRYFPLKGAYGDFRVVVDDAVPIHDHDTSFFLVRGVDQHSSCHQRTPMRSLPAPVPSGRYASAQFVGWRSLRRENADARRRWYGSRKC